MHRAGQCAFARFAMLTIAPVALPAWADPIHYQGTASLCFVGASPPVVEQDPEDGSRRISGLVSLYYIRTAPVTLEPPQGLVNGWELLISDMEISAGVYRLAWKGILTPSDYAGTSGTVLEETASVETLDLSTLSGTWLGTGALRGTSVNYTLTIIPGASPDCPGEQPPLCVDLEEGCLRAERPNVDESTVYEIVGSVN